MHFVRNNVLYERTLLLGSTCCFVLFRSNECSARDNLVFERMSCLKKPLSESTFSSKERSVVKNVLSENTFCSKKCFVRTNVLSENMISLKEYFVRKYVWSKETLIYFRWLFFENLFRFVIYIFPWVSSWSSDSYSCVEFESVLFWS